MRNFNTMKKTLLFFILFISSISQAQNIFKDDFSTYTSGQSLHSQGLWSHVNDAANGGYGAGACNPVVSGQPCFSATILDNTISYLNYGSSIKSLSIAGLLDNPGHPILPVVVNGDLYVGMVLKITTAPAPGSAVDFFRVINSDTSLVTFRLLVQDATTGFNIGIKKGSSANPTTYTSQIYNYNQDVLVILKYSHLAGANDDLLNLYVNPDYALGEPSVPTATTSSGFDQSGNIDRMVFRLGFNSVGTMPTGFAGLTSASTNWFGLGFIPLSVNQFEAKPLTILGNHAKSGSISITTERSVENATMNIYTITGALIEKQKISLYNTTNEIGIKPITTTGIYIVELIENSGKKQVQKITIN